MNQNRLYLISLALTVALGGFILGFDATGISGTVPFIKKYFDLTVIGGDVKLGWSALLNYGLPILATLTFVMWVLRNQPQTAVILKRIPGAQKRSPMAVKMELSL